MRALVSTSADDERDLLGLAPGVVSDESDVVTWIIGAARVDLGFDRFGGPFAEQWQLPEMPISDLCPAGFDVFDCRLEVALHEVVDLLGELVGVERR